MESAVICNIGACRIVNQDSVFASDQPVGVLPNLYLVADGMGGHAAGEKASAQAVSSSVGTAELDSVQPGLVYWNEKEDVLGVLSRMVEQANRDVYELAMNHAAWRGMGTTMVMAVVLENDVCCANIGDSRLYVINSEDQLQRVTVDHSFVEMMVQKGELTEEEARIHPKRNLITRAVGTEETVRPDFYTIPRDGARMVLLCSDGLSGQISEMRMNEIINMRSLSLKARVELLVNEANRNGGSDNISIILIDLEGGDGEC